MENYLSCGNCGEQDDKKTKTGARIDNVYFCEGCYNEKMEKMEAEVISSVFMQGENKNK